MRVRGASLLAIACLMLADAAQARSDPKDLLRCQTSLRQSVVRLHKFVVGQVRQCIDGLAAAATARNIDRCEAKVVKFRRSVDRVARITHRRCVDHGDLTDSDLRETLAFDRLLHVCNSPLADRISAAEAGEVIEASLACIESRVTQSTALDLLAFRPQVCDQIRVLVAGACELPAESGSETAGCLAADAVRFFEDLREVLGGCEDEP